MCEHPTTDPLQAAFEQYLVGGDVAMLLDAVRSHGSGAPDPSLDCPVAHRICDVDLEGEAFRVVRVVDLNDHTTQLFIYPTEHPNFNQPGVPIELRGAALFRWVQDELEQPTEGPTEWSRYDSALEDD